MDSDPVSADDSVSDLIGLVYEAIIDPKGWLEVLRRVADRIGSDSVVLGGGSRRRPSKGIVIPLTPNLDPDRQRRWIRAFPDPLWRTLSERFDEGVLTAAQCVEPQRVGEAELHDGALVPASVEDGLFAGIARSGDSITMVAFHRARTRERFSADDVDLVATLLPHFRRAARICDQFGLLESESDAARMVAGLVPIGIVYLDAHGHVVGANAHAERLLTEEDCLSLRQRRLRTTSRGDDAALDAAIAMAQEPGTCRTAQLVPLRESPPGGRIVMCILPVPRREAQVPLSVRSRAETIVLITGAEALASWPIPVAAKALGLTPAEADLALALARGEDLQAHATARGLSLETARWRMKQILQKTSSRRQSDVVRLVLTTLGRLVAAEISLIGSPWLDLGETA